MAQDNSQSPVRQEVMETEDSNNTQPTQPEPVSTPDQQQPPSRGFGFGQPLQNIYITNAANQEADEDRAALTRALDDSTNPCSHDGVPEDKYHTCFHEYHASFSKENLPPLLFRLEAPEQRPTDAIRPLVDREGRVLLDYDGHPIRDFPFLPRYISIRPPGWLLEFWMRSDARMGYRDIKARMVVLRGELPKDNVLNMRREREARSPLGLSCWTVRRGDVTKAELERVDRLTDQQILYNTTMDVVTVQQGGPNGSQTFLSKRNLGTTQRHEYPHDLFLDGRRVHTPSERLTNALQLRENLKEEAFRQGLQSWKDLSEQFLPGSWTPRRPRAQAASSSTPQRGTRGALKPETGPFTPYRQNNLNDVSPVPRVPAGAVVYGRDNVMGSYVANAYDVGPYESQYGGLNGRNLPFPIPSNSGASFARPPIFPSLVGADGYAGGRELQAYTPNFYGPAPAQYTTQYQPHEAFYTPIDPELFRPYRPGTSTERNLNGSLTQGDETGNQDPFRDQRVANGEAPSENIASGHHGAQTSAQTRDEDNSNYPPQLTAPSYRFNGGGPWSVRHNPTHRINTHTAEVMQRNDPFRNLQNEQVHPTSSFEELIIKDIRKAQERS